MISCKNHLQNLQKSVKPRNHSAFIRHQADIDKWLPIIVDLSHGIGRPVPSNCVAGVLPIQEINAVAKRTSDGCYIVGVNEGLFFFVEAVAEIASAYFPFDEQTDYASDIDYWGRPLFSTLLLDMLGVREYLPNVPDPRSEERRELAVQLREIATFFVVAHEYAHVILGHHIAVNGSKRQINSGQQVALDEIPLSHRLETEADVNGLILTLGFADRFGRNLALAYWAADYFLASIQFIEKFIANVVQPIAEVLVRSAERQGLSITMPLSVAPGTTHPTVEVRRAVLQKVMQSIPGNRAEDPTVVNIGLKQANLTENFILDLWDASRETFSDQLAQGLSRVE